jgi:alpha-D-xyloside xylohydrolase
MQSGTERKVYLPGNTKWIDYQTGKIYNNGWHTILVSEIPAIILVHDGAVIPHAQLAQSTDKIDWKNIELNVYDAGSTVFIGQICLPSDNKLINIELIKENDSYKLNKGAIRDVKYTICGII